MAYAESTSVPVERSRAEIERLLNKHGATDYGFTTGSKEATVFFRARKRNVLFRLPIPGDGWIPERGRATEEARAQETRRRWRALALVIKAKLESAASRIETFENAFLAQIVLPTGRTVGEEVKGNIEAAYSGKAEVRMLPMWTEGPPESSKDRKEPS